jgi:hypothetical protein
MENTSGQGSSATVPAEIDRWNWGAFLLNWVWGVGNNTFIALLMFIPLVNLVMPFVLGVKGSSWAWRNRKWDSIEEFRRVQRNWTKWALIIYAAGVLLLIGIFFAVTASLKSSDAFRLAMEKLQASQEAVQLLGTPISTGMVMGSMETTGPKGKASLAFSVSGPNGKGTVNLEATKNRGKWEIDTLVLEEDGTGKRIDLED